MDRAFPFRDSIAARMLLLPIIAIAIAFVALYCRAVGPYWKITPDSTTYVLGAQSLAHGNGYRESGSPATLLPPGTSLLLAAGWIAGGGTYRVLNAEVMLFALASLSICFLLFRASLGTLGSSVVVLLCLGSTEVFERSTFLLSEMFFVFFSLLALWLYERDNTPGAVLSTLAACLVRSVGVALAMAFLLDSLCQRKQRAHSAAYLVPLVYVALWELRNRLLGWSYTELMTENEPWNRGSGHITVARMLSRLVVNLGYGRAFEDLLTNGLTQQIGWPILPGLVLGTLIAVGFWRLFRAGKSAAGIYFILFPIVVALYWPEVVIRLMMPLLPLAFAYLVAGVQEIAERWNHKSVYVFALLFLGICLAVGFRGDLPIIAEDRTAPIPYHFVKYVGNEDIEQLALWWKAHSAESDTYACQHPNIIGIITGRSGVTYGAGGELDAVEGRLRAKHARFLFLNLNSDSDRQLALVVGQSAKFRLTRQQGRALLYELADFTPTP